MTVSTGAGLASVRREVLLLLGTLAVLAVVVIALSLRPAALPLCTFTGGVGDGPIPPGYEHCFERSDP